MYGSSKSSALLPLALLLSPAMLLLPVFPVSPAAASPATGSVLTGASYGFTVNCDT